MTKSVTMTVRIDLETSKQLEFLAATTKRSKSFLAGTAISDYAAKEAAILEAIEMGIADRDAGRVVSHDDVMKNIDSVIEQQGKNRS